MIDRRCFAAAATIRVDEHLILPLVLLVLLLLLLIDPLLLLLLLVLKGLIRNVVANTAVPELNYVVALNPRFRCCCCCCCNRRQTPQFHC